ncbi:MAG: carboxypeptidase regulatory-like domain-containing protein [Chitinophagaceae bacterium]
MKKIYFSIKTGFALLVLLLVINCIVYAQQNSNAVKGIVKNQKGETLQGVTVTIQNKDSSVVPTAVTNASGVFTVNNLQPGNSYVFKLSHVGYENHVLPNYTYNGGDEINLSLQLSATSEALNEVVVVGYGTQKKINLTGAVDQVSGDVLDNRAVPNFSQGLQGIIPNLNIRLGDGKPTQAPSYNVRGTTSIGQGGSALVLIDGVEGDPSMLNPADIATISVLKDAASTTEEPEI